MKVTLTVDEITGYIYDRLCAEFHIKKDTLKPVYREGGFKYDSEREFAGYEFEIEG